MFRREGHRRSLICPAVGTVRMCAKLGRRGSPTASIRHGDELYDAVGGKKPVIMVGSIRNRSREHIPVATFISDIERAFINSGRVSVVASAQQRGELRAERAEQSEHASIETMKRLGQELGADFTLTGKVNASEDREGGKQVLFCQTDLALTDIESNEKVWIGQKKIKKFIERSRFCG